MDEQTEILIIEIRKLAKEIEECEDKIRKAMDLLKEARDMHVASNRYKWVEETNRLLLENE